MGVKETAVHCFILLRSGNYGRLRGCQRSSVPRSPTHRFGFREITDPVGLSIDNKAAIDSSYNPENHSRTKHIERRHYFIRELVEAGTLVVPFVRSDDNLADFFTKPLKAARFFALRNKIMNAANHHASTS